MIGLNIKYILWISQKQLKFLPVGLQITRETFLRWGGYSAALCAQYMCGLVGAPEIWLHAQLR